MQLKFAIQEFLEDRHYKNLSSYTLKMYKQNLGLFLDYCTLQNVSNVLNVKPLHVKGFMFACKEEGNKPSTLNNKLRSIKVFFNYLVEEEIIEKNQHPAMRVRTVKEDIKIEVLTDKQIRELLNYFKRFNFRGNSFTAYRNRMIVIFLLSTGVRRGELTNLKWSDIDFNNQTIALFGKKRQIASIPFTKKLKSELAQYRLFLQDYFGEESEYVFTTNRNKGLTIEGVASIFKKLKKIMEFQGVRLSSHTFRHTFAHRSILNGMDVMTLQKILRHENVQMTQRYVNLWGTALKEQNDKYNPLNNIDIG
ncbi:tyrosine-type recombinase/integrase [Cytobacillus oceanisediminis]|uniref:tyrosine-type recombinase/integrase n=1 Tax=Cytobacillus oceanisediminis TaxID=665099 RepID=UPI001CCDDDF3|nr:tyrosine-type recombinase/integrase [Cytobacillus oceanisediminis]MBZ9536672.1 tyrosine-type recombinase/integrase [Cytobacillus oceanisediminis]